MNLRTTTFLPLVALIGTAALGGCFGDDERHIAWERERVVLGPLSIKNRVAYVDTARDRVIAIDADEGRPRIDSTTIGRNAIFATRTPDREQLAVITRGEEAILEGQIDEAPQLRMLDMANLDAEPRSYEIGSPFDRLAISVDGSVAVAYFSAGGFDAETGVFRNPNELAIVDLRPQSCGWACPLPG